jgi:pimeloyl-ACP methyl ester carboxylesterase
MTAFRRTGVFVSVAAAAVAVGSLLGLGACSSLPKEDVETRLLALSKNHAIAQAGLRSTQVEVPLLGEPVSVRVTYLHVPAREASAARRPIVLVHGTPSSLFTWSELLFGRGEFGGIAGERDVYAIEVIGHGVTRTETPPYSFQKCADFVAGAIDALAIGPVHLVGNSYGGEFCWRAALDRPDLISTLTLLDSSGYTRPDDGWMSEEVAMREMSLAPYGWLFNDAEKVRGALQPHFPDPVGDDQVQEIFTLCENADNWEAMVALARDENGTREDEIPGLSMPTLILWGADDIALPAATNAERFARDLPGAHVRILERCGHYPQETVPAVVARELLGFIDRAER